MQKRQLLSSGIITRDGKEINIFRKMVPPGEFNKLRILWPEQFNKKTPNHRIVLNKLLPQRSWHGLRKPEFQHNTIEDNRIGKRPKILSTI